MKRFIKSSGSDYSPEMWDRVRKQAPNGYLYIFKHGVGPGTIPDDVKVLKWKDLPNYYTAVWLDRWLDTDELKEYDIPSETDINYYLDRIGYCKKDGDVVPCDSVEACGSVMASTEPIMTASFGERAKQLAEKAWKIGKTREKALDYIMDKMGQEGYYVDYPSAPETIKTAIDAFYNKWGDDLCCSTNIKASIDSDIAKYKKSLERKASKSGVYENFGADEVRKLREKYSELPDDDTDYRTAERNRSSISSFEDWCMNYVGASSDPKYMANMVSCSTDDVYYDDDFLVEGYYDNQYRGLAESAETSDVYVLNEYINDYANRGYFIKVHNLTDGVITEFSPDNWFDDLSRTGGATLFMSW